jgi:hypothetical protein
LFGGQSLWLEIPILLDKRTLSLHCETIYFLPPEFSGRKVASDAPPLVGYRRNGYHQPWDFGTGFRGGPPGGLLGTFVIFSIGVLLVNAVGNSTAAARSSRTVHPELAEIRPVLTTSLPLRIETAFAKLGRAGRMEKDWMR